MEQWTPCKTQQLKKKHLLQIYQLNVLENRAGRLTKFRYVTNEKHLNF